LRGGLRREAPKLSQQPHVRMEINRIYVLKIVIKIVIVKL
jgi:hypothetical protein